KLVEIRRGMVNAHGERAEIVQTGNFHLARIHRLNNAGHKRDPRAVAQFGILEAKDLPDFAQHRPPIAMAMGIPAGGKCVHKTEWNGAHSATSEKVFSAEGSSNSLGTD